jgi:hypothetical protein
MERVKSRRNITIRNVVSRQVHHKPHIDWNLDDIDHTRAMMMIVVIMIESMMILTSRMTMAIMIAIMTMITIRIDRRVSLGNGYVRTNAFTLDHPHTELRACRLEGHLPKRVLCPLSETRDLARALQPYVTTNCQERLSKS